MSLKRWFLWNYTNNLFRVRLLFSSVIFLLFVVVIFGRLLFVVYSDNNVFFYNKKDRIFRNDIVDRNGIKIAVNLTVVNLFCHPSLISNCKQYANLISEALDGVSYEEVFNIISSNKNFAWIKKNLSPVEQARIKKLALAGIEVESIEKRFYPYQELLSHVLGYTDIDNSGISGIEKGLDSLIIDKNKKDLELSIDVKLQAIVAEEVIHAKEKFHAKGANLIIADVTTGEILSYICSPSFNPNKINIKDSYALMNRNSLGLYEMGSIFKGLTMAIALDTGTTTLTDIYDVSTFKVGKYDFQDYLSNKGYFSTAKILTRSSNRGIGKIAIAVGKESIFNYFAKMNLLSKLDSIEIVEKAQPIFVPYSQWNNLTLTTTSYGYSIAISPLHYLQAMLPIINNGMFLPLTFIKSSEPKFRKQIFKKETSESMRALLRLVVSDGTARAMEIDGLEIGGKTGTANVNSYYGYNKNKRRSSIFAAFPMNDPKYIIYAMLDEPEGIRETNMKATSALSVAPMVRKIILKMSSLYGIKKQNTNMREQFRYLLNPPIDSQLTL